MNQYHTLEDYRLRYPNTASVPTITQRGLVGELLDRHERRGARRIRRRAVWQHVMGLPIQGVLWMWKAVTTTPAPVVSFRA